jgi:hypothetical protein
MIRTMSSKWRRLVYLPMCGGRCGGDGGGSDGGGIGDCGGDVHTKYTHTQGSTLPL